MTCPLCGQRKAKRHCPGLNRQLCAVCCGTKRGVEIQCPSDCVYLTSAREHPPAATVRQQQRDLATILRFVRDLNERQSQLFFVVTSFLRRYRPAELQSLLDDDVADAAAALAATLETSARGVIYEHHASSLPAERLAASLKPILDEAGQDGGSPFERDAAVVLRRVEEAARAVRAADGVPTAFLDLLGRVIRRPEEEPPADGGAPAEPPRLIVP